MNKPTQDSELDVDVDNMFNFHQIDRDDGLSIKNESKLSGVPTLKKDEAANSSIANENIE